MFIRKKFPNGLRSLSGFVLIILVLGMMEPAIGAMSVQAETVTQEQVADLQKQEESARIAKEEADRLKALEAVKSEFRESGTTLDVNAISDSTLELAKRIKQATPLDLRSSLAAAVYSQKFNLRPSLLLAVISKESNFHQFSVGSHNDRGYMQIIPPTERFMMRNYGAPLGLKYNPKQIFEPEYNLGLGAAYLGGMLAEYGDVDQTLTEYNRGEGRAENYFERNNSYSTSYSRKVLELEQLYTSLN